MEFDWETIKKMTATFLGKTVVTLVVLTVLALFAFSLFYMFFVNVVDNYEVGYKFDMRVGKIQPLIAGWEVKDGKRVPVYQHGWIVTPPFIVKVHTIDTRPTQVSISANNRVLNAKLVSFNPDGMELFLSWHGRKDYSIEDLAPGGFVDILKSYAYDDTGRKYPFLNISTQLRASGAPVQ
jgi:hypothetical protein